MLPRTHTDADAPSAHPNADGQRALFPMRPEKGHEILVVALFFLAVLLTASLLTYHPLDPSLLHDAPDGAPEPRNLIGHAGAQLAAVAFALLGIVALLLPLPLAFALWQRVRHRTGLFDRLRLFGMAAIALSLPALVQLSISDFGWRGETLQPGGVLGVLIADGLSALLNEIGARVVLLMCLFVGGSLAVRATFSELFADARGLLQRVTDRTWRWRVQRQRRRQPDDAAVDDVPTDDATTAHAAAMRDDAPAIDDAFDAVLRRAEPASAEGDDATQRRWLRPRLRPVVVTAPAPAGLDRRRSSSRRELFTRRKGVVDGPLRVRQRFAYDADTRSYDVDATPRVLARGTAAATAYPVADPADGRAPAPRDLFHAPTDGRAPIARVRTMPRDARPQPAPSFDAPASRDARTPTDGAPLDEPITIPHPDETAARGAEPVAAPRPAPQSTPTSRRRTSSLRETAPRETARPAQRVLDFDAARSRRSSAVDAPVETAETERFNADGEALPPLELLRCDAPRDAHDLAQLEQLGTVLKQALEDFGVAGELAGIQPGPVITVYEFQPAPGVKVSKIVNLQDDLALALKADSVRVDRIPGRSTLGIEVPNVERSVIRLGGLIADDDFQEGTFTLPMALGVDIYGKPVYADLAKMPHLLVAGATGAGKSVGLQSMITSILYQSTRHDVKFIFIDPKRVELGVYADIPHLKTEVVVDPKKAANALRWAVGEMERRYRLLASAHVRSIAYFNRLVADPSERERLALRDGGDDEFGVDDLQPLPYTVIIIDELADLMMVAASDVETSIARLAQMARAVGIHLIVATQRPSVDVLTGTIKANFPCRIAYATATRHDSRTILDQVGAEKLLGRGDALFMPPGTSRIRRLHGAYITEEETAGLIRWLKRHGKPDLDLKVLEDPEEAREGATTDAGERDDPLYDDACRLAVRERMGSASFLQRRMRIGFSRASRLIDMMELDGILGPSQGSKPREVLVPPGYFDELDGARNDTDPDREL